MLDFPDRLNHALEQKGWSQQQLAAAMGVHEVSVSRWKRMPPPSRTLRKIAVHLGCDAQWLEYGTSPTSTQPPLRLQDAAAEWPEDITDLPDATAQLKTLAENMETTNPIGIPGLVKMGRELLDRIEALARATILRKQISYRETLKRPVEQPTPQDP